MKKLFLILCPFFLMGSNISAKPVEFRPKFLNRQNHIQTDEKAEEIIKKAVEKLGGAKYLQVNNRFDRKLHAVSRRHG